MTFHIYLAILSAIYFIFLIIVTKRDKLKRELGLSFFFALVVYYLAVEPNYSKIALAAYLTILVMYNIYIMMKKR